MLKKNEFYSRYNLDDYDYSDWFKVKQQSDDKRYNTRCHH